MIKTKNQPVLLFCAFIYLLGFSSIASARTYFDTPEGRRPPKAGEWTVGGGVGQGTYSDGLSTGSSIGIDYYLTPSISLDISANFNGYNYDHSEYQQLQLNNGYSTGIRIDVTDNFSVRLNYGWDSQFNSYQPPYQEQYDTSNRWSVDFLYTHLK